MRRSRRAVVPWMFVNASAAMEVQCRGDSGDGDGDEVAGWHLWTQPPTTVAPTRSRRASCASELRPREAARRADVWWTAAQRASTFEATHGRRPSPRRQAEGFARRARSRQPAPRRLRVASMLRSCPCQPLFGWRPCVAGPRRGTIALELRAQGNAAVPSDVEPSIRAAQRRAARCTVLHTPNRSCVGVHLRPWRLSGARGA